LVTPTDHFIGNVKAYEAVVKEAEDIAGKGYLVTFGIKPEYPETGYGYIEADGNNVLSFREKPDAETAAKYLRDGNYYWNSGMFVFKVKTYLQELEKHSPEILKYSIIAYENALKANPLEIGKGDMNAIPANSIDYAVMEKSNIIKVLPADISWSDLGSFEMLFENKVKDENGNVKTDKVVCLNAHNNFIIPGDRVISTVDVDDLIIIDTADALFISKNGSSSKIKSLLDRLEKIDADVVNIHTAVHRPWGSYTILEHGYRCKIKKIVVKPGKRLSLQKHFHRNEHWTVVNGTAIITIEDKQILVKTNESTYIPAGQLHRLENPGKIDLVIIETQVGDYLEEDDIVRLDDDYKRSV